MVKSSSLITVTVQVSNVLSPATLRIRPLKGTSIGATLDAVDVAKELSIKTHNSFSFDKSEMSSKVWDKLNTSMSSYFDKKSKGLNTDKLFED